MNCPTDPASTHEPRAVSAEVRSAHRRFQVVGVVVPLLLASIGVALQWWWVGDLPDPAATHFNGSSPDGFGPAWTYPVLTEAVVLVMVALTAVIGWQSQRFGSWGLTQRLVGALMPGFVLLVTVDLTWTVESQRGLADAADAPQPGWLMLVGAAVGLAYGVAAWFLQLDVRTVPDGAREARARSVGTAEKVAWMQTVTPGPAARAILGVTLLAVALTAVGMTVWNDSTAAALVLWGVLLLLVLSTAMMTAFRVRIDASGLSVRSVLGVPRWQIPLHEITAARSIPVNPLGDFGGWGVRWQPGAGVGIVTRRGEALQVEYRNGKRLTVTVDDSARASDLLMGLRERAARG